MNTTIYHHGNITAKNFLKKNYDKDYSITLSQSAWLCD